MLKDLTKTKLNIVQVSFIKPILNELQRLGCNIDGISKSSGLSNYNLEDLENYFPVPILYKVLSNISKQQGITNIASTFEDVIKVTSLSSWGNMVAFAPNVISACELASKYGDAILSNETIGLDIDGPISTYWQVFSGKDQSGKEQVDFKSMSLALNGFKIACGEDWEPLELHFQSKEINDLGGIISENSNTKIYFSQPRSAIVFPTGLLNLPMLRKENPNIKNYIQQDFTTVSSKINQLLNANNRCQLPSLDVISEQFDMSSRTLQRYLKAEDITYEHIIDQWRFTNSLKLIEHSNYKINEIAQRMGYANASNFNRAFIRWTSTTPANYKEQLNRMS